MVKDRLLVLMQALHDHIDDETLLTTVELICLMEQQPEAETNPGGGLLPLIDTGYFYDLLWNRRNRCRGKDLMR